MSWTDRLFVGVIGGLCIFMLVNILEVKQQQEEIRSAQKAIRQTQVDIANTLNLLAITIDAIKTRYGWHQAALSGQCHPEILDLIDRAWLSSSRRVPLEVFRQLIWVESRCLPCALSPAGAIGLGQIMPATAEQIHPGSAAWLTDPELNLHLSSEYLDWLLDQSAGDLVAALTMYNWGLGRYQSGISNDNYAMEVLNSWVE